MVQSRSGRRGKIVTFYSYKGGTGRSMLLANVAWVLASGGKRVLVVDWDLEAPGLHRFFHPFLLDPELASTEGLIDFLTDYMVDVVTPAVPTEGGSGPGPRINISRYAVSLDYDGFPSGATIDFVPAGRQTSSYAARVNAFNWHDFYARLGGGAFVEEVKRQVRAEYDYVLIDSRTGVSDTAGVCTVQLPDDLVVCFTLNTQSIKGAGAVAASVQRQRDIRIHPVPSRVEFAEKEMLDAARDYVRATFDGFLERMTPQERESYWGRVETMYQPFYAYEEILSTFADRPRLETSMLAAVERIAGYVTGGDVTRHRPLPESERLRILSDYRRKRQERVEETRVTRLGAELAAKDRLVHEKEREVSELAKQRQRLERKSRRSVVWIFATLSGAVLAIALVTIVLTRSSRGALTADLSDLDFGSVVAGHAVERTMTIKAVEDVGVTNVSLGGSNPGDFVLDSRCRGIRLEKGQSCTMKMLFAPISVGRLSAVVTLGSDQADRPATVLVAGTSAPPTTPAPSVAPARSPTRPVSPTPTPRRAPSPSALVIRPPVPTATALQPRIPSAVPPPVVRTPLPPMPSLAPPFSPFPFPSPFLSPFPFPFPFPVLPTAPVPGAQVQVSLTADPATFKGTCPVTVTFTGTISMSGSGTVTYRFIRSDSAVGPLESIDFAAGETKQVRTTWTLGAPGLSYSGWEAIEVFQPVRGTSPNATFSVQC